MIYNQICILIIFSILGNPFTLILINRNKNTNYMQFFGKEKSRNDDLVMKCRTINAILWSKKLVRTIILIMPEKTEEWTFLSVLHQSIHFWRKKSTHKCIVYHGKPVVLFTNILIHVISRTRISFLKIYGPSTNIFDTCKP